MMRIYKLPVEFSTDPDPDPQLHCFLFYLNSPESGYSINNKFLLQGRRWLGKKIRRQYCAAPRIYLFIYAFIYLAIYLSFNQSIDVARHPLTPASILQYIYPPSHSANYLSIYPSNSLSILLSN